MLGMVCCASTLTFKFKEPKAVMSVMYAIKHSKELNNITIHSDNPYLFAHISAIKGLSQNISRKSGLDKSGLLNRKRSTINLKSSSKMANISSTELNHKSRINIIKSANHTHMSINEDNLHD